MTISPEKKNDEYKTEGWRFTGKMLNDVTYYKYYVILIFLIVRTFTQSRNILKLS